jgi:hypothetical protein
MKKRFSVFFLTGFGFFQEPPQPSMGKYRVSGFFWASHFIELMLKGFVDGNFDYKFYTFI